MASFLRDAFCDWKVDFLSLSKINNAEKERKHELTNDFLGST